MAREANAGGYIASGSLLVVGSVLLLLEAHYEEPMVGDVRHYLGQVAALAVCIASGIGACLLLASRTVMSFGSRSGAILGLAAVSTLSLGLAGLVGLDGLFGAFSAGMGLPAAILLLMWLFELEPLEALLCALYLCLGHMAAAVFLIMPFAD